ncbi:unnamed protein product [Phytophthora lilii]|uniref:Unnamed protein product n=1 Tax=Phytophthora lilii TaxID=2077276 RepID=A0A9W6X745_9STRA|nr:unnamed protein product [Phytophthora lilii]
MPRVPEAIANALALVNSPMSRNLTPFLLYTSIDSISAGHGTFRSRSRSSSEVGSSSGNKFVRAQLAPQRGSGLKPVVESVCNALHQNVVCHDLLRVDCDRKLEIHAVFDRDRYGALESPWIATDESSGEVLDRVARMQCSRRLFLAVCGATSASAEDLGLRLETWGLGSEVWGLRLAEIFGSELRGHPRKDPRETVAVESRVDPKQLYAIVDTHVSHRASANHEARTWFEDSGSLTPTDFGQSQARILSSSQDGSFFTFKVYPEGGCAST